jgi:hypothetical protein
MVSPLGGAHLPDEPRRANATAAERPIELAHSHAAEVHMNRNPFFPLRHLLATLLALAALAPRVQSQSAYAPGPTLDAARVGLSLAARSSPVQTRAAGTTLNRAGNVVASTAAGALAGWFAFTITVGALASDHGAPYKRERRRWMIDGAALGALIGAFSPIEHHRYGAAAW